MAAIRSRRHGRRRVEPTMRRLIAILVAASASALLSFADCGGRIYGYVDDAGVYHAGDGAVLFVPGSACVGFDASHVADPSPLCGIDADTDEAAVCASWPSEPPGFPFLDTSICTADIDSCDRTPCVDAGADSGTFHCLGGYDPTKIVACPSRDAVGDTFCTAYAQQFVITGQAVGVCDWNKATLEHPDAPPNICFLSSTPKLHPPVGLCLFNRMAVLGTDAAVVDEASGVGCRYPCEP